MYIYLIHNVSVELLTTRWMILSGTNSPLAKSRPSDQGIQ